MFSENKRFSSFFCKWTNKIQAFNYAAIENFTPFELIPDLSGNRPQIYELYCSVCKKLEKILLSENVVFQVFQFECL